MRGRKPKPTVLKELHGNPGKRPLPKNEPVALGTLNEPPEWMPADAMEAWRYAMAHAPRGVLRRIDRGLLVAWAVAESLHRDATLKQEAIGALVYKPKGSEVFLQSPYLAIINKQALIMVKLASELGFSPASRPRLDPNRRGAGDDVPAPAPMESDDAGDPAAPPPLASFLASNPDRRRLN